MMAPAWPPGTLPKLDAHPDARPALLAWAREILADIAHHPDATLRHACTVILTHSADHTDRQRAAHIAAILQD